MSCLLAAYTWGSYWTLGRIRGALRAGHTPQTLGGLFLGCGGYRMGWRLGPFVVKGFKNPIHEGQPEHWHPSAIEAIRAGGVRIAPTVRVNGWMIQPYYQPLDDRSELPTHRRRDGGDWAMHNMGRDHRGRLVAFDW